MARAKSKSRRRRNAEAPPTQEEILMVANDAALEGDYEDAAKLVAGDPQKRRVKIYTSEYTPFEEDGSGGDMEAAGEGEYKLDLEAGEIEEVVDSGELEAYQIEMDIGPVTCAIALAVARVLDHDGVSEYSSSGPWYRDGWYKTDADENYRTGGWTEKSFHLEGFTDEESSTIYRMLFDDRGRRRRGKL